MAGTADHDAAGVAPGTPPNTTPAYWLAVPAAGSGARFGGAVPKQHLPLDGATVIEVALRPFLADDRCRGMVLALAASDPRRDALSAALPPRVRIVTGGAERVDSVLAALDALPSAAQEHDWVLVHDAARPCLSERDLRALLQAGADSEHGALLAVPLADTLKQADSGSDGMARVGTTLPREGLWRALTPQMFRRGALTAALRAARAAGRVPTDEAQAIEWQGGRPLLVAARDGNHKITTGDDLSWAAATLAARRSAGGQGDRGGTMTDPT